MGLKSMLEKMKLIECPPDEADLTTGKVLPKEPAKPAKPAKPDDPLRQILETLPPPKIDEKTLPKSSPGSPSSIPDFASIYNAAGVTAPAHGYTAFKVLEILSAEGFQALDNKAKAAAVTSVLKMNPTGPVPIADIVQDAVRRDQALDSFEEFLRTKLEGRSQQVEKENAQLQAEIDALARKNREKMDANRKGLNEEQRAFSDWQTKKRSEERKLYDAVAPFVEANPVTLSGQGSRKP